MVAREENNSDGGVAQGGGGGGARQLGFMLPVMASIAAMDSIRECYVLALKRYH